MCLTLVPVQTATMGTPVQGSQALQMPALGDTYRVVKVVGEGAYGVV